MKRCGNCAHSYMKLTDMFGPRRAVQLCSSPEYNSEEYTHEMFMEDRAGNCCRFWAPKHLGGQSK